MTNERFARFVEATGFVTEAEQFGWSFVFQTFLDERLSAPAPIDTPWWRRIDGACWRSPEGFGSTIEGREDHPAVHVSWNDAQRLRASGAAGAFRPRPSGSMRPAAAPATGGSRGETRSRTTSGRSAISGRGVFPT